MGLSFAGIGENSSNNTAQERISSWILGISISPQSCPPRVPMSGIKCKHKSP